MASPQFSENDETLDEDHSQNLQDKSTYHQISKSYKSQKSTLVGENAKKRDVAEIIKNEILEYETQNNKL